MPDDFDPRRFAIAVTRDVDRTYELASAGDKLSAKEAISKLLHDLKLAECIDPATGQRLPLAADARAYLESALQKIAMGKSADEAFNLRKSGKQIWTYWDKIIIGQHVYQRIQQGKSVETAIGEVFEFVTVIRQKLCESVSSPYSNFREKGLKEETIRKWYFEMKDRLAQIDSVTRTSALE